VEVRALHEKELRDVYRPSLIVRVVNFMRLRRDSMYLFMVYLKM
jgi:hypothetical protein